MTKTIWNSMSLKERVLRSGMITPQEIAEVLEISLSHARNLVKEVKTSKQSVQGRSGIPYSALIDMLYSQRSESSFARARKLEAALGVRRRAKQLHIVPTGQADLPDAPPGEIEAEGSP